MHLVKSGEIEKEYALILEKNKMKDCLQITMMCILFPDQEMVFRRVEDARDFVSCIEKFLS